MPPSQKATSGCSSAAQVGGGTPHETMGIEPQRAHDGGVVSRHEPGCCGAITGGTPFTTATPGDTTSVRPQLNSRSRNTRATGASSRTTSAPSAAFTNFMIWKLWWLRRILNVELFKMSSSLFIPEAGIELLLELMQAPEGRTQRELGDSLRLRGSTISVAVTKLVEEGLVSRSPDEVDGRAWRVRLEKKAPTGELAEQFEGYESFLTKKYTKQELQLVGRVLDDCIQLLKGTTWLPPANRRLDPDD